MNNDTFINLIKRQDLFNLLEGRSYDGSDRICSPQGKLVLTKRIIVTKQVQLQQVMIGEKLSTVDNQRRQPRLFDDISIPVRHSRQPLL